MAEQPKITVALDAEIVAQTRDAVGASDEQPDGAVVERALNAFLLRRVHETSNARSDLSEDEANELAVQELRAARRGRAA